MTDATSNRQRMETILDALATSNRSAKANLEAIRNLTRALIFVGLVLLATHFHGRHPK